MAGGIIGAGIGAVVTAGANGALSGKVADCGVTTGVGVASGGISMAGGITGATGVGIIGSGLLAGISQLGGVAGTSGIGLPSVGVIISVWVFEVDLAVVSTVPTIGVGAGSALFVSPVIP